MKHFSILLSSLLFAAAAHANPPAPGMVIIKGADNDGKILVCVSKEYVKSAVTQGTCKHVKDGVLVLMQPPVINGKPTLATP